MFHALNLHFNTQWKFCIRFATIFHFPPDRRKKFCKCVNYISRVCEKWSADAHVNVLCEQMIENKNGEKSNEITTEKLEQNILILNQIIRIFKSQSATHTRRAVL